VLPKELLDALKPEYVSPLVAKLAHESTEDTGGLYEVGGGFVGKLRWERTAGKTFRLGRTIAPEDVNAAWAAISSFDSGAKASHPGSVAESMGPIMANVEAGPSRGGNQFIDVDAALGYTYPEFTWKYDERDVSLYALGVGAAHDPTDERDLALVYELSGRGMKVLPSFAVLPAINMIFTQGKNGVSAPGLTFGLDRVLHGEQYTELVRPLSRAGTLTTKATVKHIYDKGKNALVVTEFASYDEHGDVVARNEVTTVVRGAGGWGGERGPSAEVNVPPDRAPDKVVEDKTSENQALLYRLSGDWNPLHADPGFAKAFGFARPILHGLCSFGYATRQVAQAFAPDGNVEYVRSIKARFASTVLPGETLVTEMWKDGDTRVVFRTKVKERGEVCISNAAVELWPLGKELPKPKVRGAKLATGTGPAVAVPVSGDIFRAIDGFVKANPATAEKVKTTFLFKLSAPESAWTVELSTPPGRAVEGAHGTAACTLEMTDADFMAMATGQADAMKLFSTGKLKISGDVMASQKLGFLKKLTPEMVLAEAKKRTGGGGGGGSEATTAAAAPSPADFVPTTADVFSVIEEYLKQHPDLAPKVGVTYLWKIGDHRWLLDLTNGVGSVTRGGDTGECTLELAESDFLDLTQGKADAMKLFTTGKLKISGNVMASQKLQFLSKLDPKAAVDAVMKRRDATPTVSAKSVTATAPAAPAAQHAAKFFAALDKRLADSPALKQEVRGTLTFVVGDARKTYDLGGSSAEAPTTITVADADLPQLAAGNARSLFQHGKLRVDGDMSVVHRLGFLNKLIDR
jgi:3-hydroxyacyl-CoA dehydrogenase/3a,7a,12a-trihydroxy-5b-cholest-24-enoyl-CoA hydratase